MDRLYLKDSVNHCLLECGKWDGEIDKMRRDEESLVKEEGTWRERIEMKEDSP